MGWFPVGRNDENGWRLDIVSLLAVIGESSMEEHSQVLTSSWTCMLPRIIPAPQAMLKPTRPTRLPQVNATIVGVHNGTSIPTLNYFPNIIHPVEDLKPLSFKVLTIKHKNRRQSNEGTPAGDQLPQHKSTATSVDLHAIESGPGLTPPRRRSTMRPFTGNPDKPKPRVPSRILSPLNILSIASCVLTIGLVIWAALIQDGTALTALGTISLVSSIVGYASSWSPVLMERDSRAKVPPGDVVIRTREGAFLLVKCDEDVARELYTGTEGCKYTVKTKAYRFLVALGTFLLMVSVVLLGNCNFAMQAAVGASYIVLNGAYWAVSLVNKRMFWDLSSYECEEATPPDAEHAHKKQSETIEGKPNFTRTLWYAIRETKKTGWVRSSGAAPRTPQWDEWLKQAEQNAKNNNREWDAVGMRDRIVGQSDAPQQAETAHVSDTAAQHAPAVEVPPPTKQ